MDKNMVAKELVKLAKGLVGGVQVHRGSGAQFELGPCSDCGTKTRFWTYENGRGQPSIRLCQECAKTYYDVEDTESEAHRIKDLD